MDPYEKEKNKPSQRHLVIEILFERPQKVTNTKVILDILERHMKDIKGELSESGFTSYRSNDNYLAVVKWHFKHLGNNIIDPP